MLKLLDRLVLKELTGPFLFGVAMFALLMIATVAMDDAARFVSRYDLPLSMFFKLFGLAIPQFVVLSIPMGVLLGTLISVGRLNNDQEIVALRACGISLFRVLAPYLVVGAFLSGLTFLGNELIVPACNTKLKDMKNAVVAGQVGRAHQERMIWPIYSNGKPEWLLLADSVKGDTLLNVKLFYFHPKDKDKDYWLDAARAEWRGASWTFYNVRTVQVRPSAKGDDQAIVELERMSIPDFRITPNSLTLRAKTTDDLSIARLSELIHEWLVTKQYAPTDKEIRVSKTQLYFKTSIPLSPLFFILAALPLAVTAQRSSRTTGIGKALLIVVIYYGMFTLLQKLGGAGALPPLVAGWTPNALLALGGIALLRRREHS